MSVSSTRALPVGGKGDTMRQPKDKKINFGDNPEWTAEDFKRARKSTPKERARFRAAFINTFGSPPPKRGPLPKTPAERYVPTFIKLHPGALAWAKAEARDCINAGLLALAPVTASTRALWALIASCRKIGSAWLLMEIEVRRSLGYCRNCTSTSLPPCTIAFTCMGP